MKRRKPGEWASDHRIPDQLCPSCGHRITHAGSPDKKLARPKAGDWNVCIRCAAVTTYDESGHFRLLNAEERTELAELPADHEVRRLQAVILLMGVQMPWPKESSDKLN